MKKSLLICVCTVLCMLISCTQQQDSKENEETHQNGVMTQKSSKFNPALNRALTKSSDEKISVIIQTTKGVDDVMLSELKKNGLTTQLTINKKITAIGTAKAILSLDEIEWVRAVELSQTKNSK